uniref:CCHC-type domain-containing protein n=1 Tax=Scylla olivacea TaxID=85551 RepID=A0A0P4WC15_SCYOL
MVRFARAEGSKGSNKKQYEDATPWTEIVSQLETSKNKRKKNHNEEESEKKEGIIGQTAKKKKTIDTGKQETGPQNAFQTIKDPKTDEKEGHPVPSIQNAFKKSKKEKKKSPKTSEPGYTINSEGKRVKVFRNGTERTWFDLPYEESDTMTRYDGMWVKKAMVGELDRLKAALEEEGLDKKGIMKRMMKAKRKAHRELRIELIYQQKNLVSEAGGEKNKTDSGSKSNAKVKKNKKKNQKPVMIGNGSLSSPDKENSMQIKENKCKQLDEQSIEVINLEVEQMSDDNDGAEEDDTKLMMISQTSEKTKHLEALTPQPDGKKKKNKKDKLETDVATQINQESENEDDKEEPVTPQPDSKKKKNKLETEIPQSPINIQHKTEADKKIETYDYNTNKMDHESSSQIDFEENELMTYFEGYWVLRKEVEELEAAKEAELEAIYAARTDGSRGELTEKEKIVLQRAVKKRKRFFHKKLIQKLSEMGKRMNNNKKGNKDTKKDDSEKVVKFDGFFVKKEAADRLHKLRSKLFKEGLSRQEVDKLMQKERRKEERVLKNERKLLCLNCRQPGHMVSACPNLAQADGEGQASICYTCGSTEHSSSSCNLKKGSEKSFSFATCYICKESGHIARQCPDNPRGLYPRGGACRGCGSVEHLAKDCPDLQKENAENTITMKRMKGEELEALDEDDEAADQDTSPSPSKWTKPKVVKY